MKTMLIRVLGRATGAGLILAAAAIVLLITLLTAWPNNEAAAQGSVPDKPARPTAETVSHDSVTFSWADPGDSSITGYQVFRRNWSTDDAGAFNVIQDDTGNADTSYTDGSVDPSTRYSYRLKARNANGLSARSGYVRVDTPAAPTTTPTPEPTATPAPTPSREENRGEEQGEQGNSENSEQQGRSHSNQPQNLRATVVTYERIRIDWNQAPSGITHYKIGRSGGGLPGYEEVGQITTWDSNSNLKPDSSYTFTVRLGTSDSHFGPASSITVTTLAIPTPTNLRRTRSGTSGASAVADFEWDNPSDTTNLQQVSAIYDGNMAT